MKKLLIIIVVIGAISLWLENPTISAPSSGTTFSYIIKYSGSGSSSDALPMLVALHGNGDTASNFYEYTLDELNVPARIILLEGPISRGRGAAWPWTQDELTLYGNAVSEVTKLLAIEYPTKGKPVLLGFSGGGMMAYYQALRHGDTYSYIFPISGKLSEDLLDDNPLIVSARVYSFHGNKDSVIPINGGKNAIKILKANGVRVRLKEFDGGHHGIATNMKSEITRAVEKKLQGL